MDKMRQDKKEEEELGEEKVREMMAAMSGNVMERWENRPQASWKVTSAARAGDLAKLQHLLERGPSIDKEEALRESARMGHLEVVQYLMDQYDVCVDAEEVDFPNATALILAAGNGHLDVVQYLAGQEGADVDATDRRGFTVLMCAVSDHHVGVVKYLVEECGADLYAENREGDTALMLAAGNGHIDIVKYLADRSTVHVNTKNANGSTPLQRAAERGHVDVMQYLAKEHGAEADSRDNAGYTPLMRAANYGQIGAVKYLACNCGADVNARSKDGSTALVGSAQSGYIDVVKYLTEECGADTNGKNKVGKTALMKAAEHGCHDVVQYLTDQCDSDVNEKDNNGYTTLMGAAQHGHLDVVQYLAGQHGTNVHATTNDGYTALMWAVENDHMNIVQYLVENCGADVNAKKIDGNTATMWASRNDRVELVKYLVGECDADVHGKDNNGVSAMAQAAGKGHIDIVRYLARQCGADVNMVNSMGETALMLAAANGHVEVVECLADECGADVNAKDDGGYTALMKAAGNGRAGVVRYLVEKCDADVNTKGKDGANAVGLAAAAGYHSIQRTLTPFLADEARADENQERNSAVMPSVNRYSGCSIPPLEIELVLFSQNGSLGGDFQAKWLDADAVVKLFIPDASHSSFEDEVRLWERLRHPNVTKIYGACYANPQLQFFVCEYASQGSLQEYAASLSVEERIVWKYLHDAALGLEYLHERGIVHGDLRCSNILIGSDGIAKLSNFALSGRTKRSDPFPHGVFRGKMAWQAPEILRGEPPSYKSDVYSLGACIIEAEDGDSPFGLEDDPSDEDKEWVRTMKLTWDPETQSGYGEDSNSDSDSDSDLAFLSRMLHPDPHKRATLSSVLYELERLAARGEPNVSQPELEPATSFDEYAYGELKEAWVKLETSMEDCSNVQYRQAFDELKIVHKRLQGPTHHPELFVRFHEILNEFHRTIKMTPEQIQMMQLSSTRATSTSMYAYQWRIKSLLSSMGEPSEAPTEQTPFFVSGVSDTFLLLRELKSTEEQSAFVRVLRAEIDNTAGKYTADQLEVMKRAYTDLARKFEGKDSSELTPEWFIPCESSTFTSSFSQSFSSAWDDPSATQAQADLAKRAEALAMFRREVDIWFRFSHPHVVRLFGACHVGRPFFVCEFAANGTLVSYLRAHPDEIWEKLHEAALGVQYLHARGVVHGDLKGNNIVIGSDLKAKVTDFGLSSVASGEDKALVSGAWNWVAPELLDSTTHPSFASDMYSLGMCIVEALRVVEAVKLGTKDAFCLPWHIPNKGALIYQATRGALPSRPAMCEDCQWELVERMCVLDPQKRIKISTVVDELARLANTNTSPHSRNHSGAGPPDSVGWDSVANVLAAARLQLEQLQGSVNHRDEVLSQHVALLERYERVFGQIHGKQSDQCRAGFGSLVADVNAAVSKLQARSGNLIALAKATMRCFALDRALSKLCDTYFIHDSGGFDAITDSFYP